VQFKVLGQAMPRRSRASGKQIKSRRRTAAMPKPGAAPRLRHRSCSAVNQEDEFTRLRRERDEALERETATSEVLHLISKSPGNLELVFRSILENATRICGAVFGGMFRFENGTVEIVAKLGLPQKFFEFLQSEARRPGPLHPFSRVIKSRRTVHIADYRTDQAYLERDPLAIGGVEVGGIRTLLVVPMLKDKDNALVGFVGIFSQ
jgi:two-component system, NtrC family, sensor kinase